MAAELKGHIDDAKALMGVNNELRHQLRAEKQLREEAEERLAERSRPSSPPSPTSSAKQTGASWGRAPQPQAMPAASPSAATAAGAEAPTQPRQPTVKPQPGALLSAVPAHPAPLPGERRNRPSHLRVLIHKRSFDASALRTGGSPRTGWHMNGAPTAVRLASGGWAAAAGPPQPQPQPQQPQPQQPQHPQLQPQHPVPHQHSAAMQPPPQMPEPPMGPNDPRWHHIAPRNRPSWAAPPPLHLQPHPMAQSPQPVRWTLI